jgi:hypothetical protein
MATKNKKNNDDPRKKPLWSPGINSDGTYEFHLGDLMYNIERCKELDRLDKKKGRKKK